MRTNQLMPHREIPLLVPTSVQNTQIHCMGKCRIHQPENFADSGSSPLYRAFDYLFFIILKTCVGVRRYTNHNRPGLWIKGSYCCTLLNISCLNKCQLVTAFVVDFSVLGEIAPALNWIDMLWEFFDYTCM
jgi:hypothetical protein